MYVNTTTKEILGLGALRKVFPKTSFPSKGPNINWQNENGYAPFVSVPTPLITDEEVIKMDGAELIADTWQTKWTVRDKTLVERIIDWEVKMNNKISDDLENIIAVLTQSQLGALDIITKAKYDAKVVLRTAKPV